MDFYESNEAPSHPPSYLSHLVLLAEEINCSTPLRLSGCLQHFHLGKCGHGLGHYSGLREPEYAWTTKAAAGGLLGHRHTPADRAQSTPRTFVPLPVITPVSNKEISE